jgi:hypothetical protein
MEGLMTSDLQSLIDSIPVTRFSELKELLAKLQPSSPAEKALLPLIRKYVSASGMKGIEDLRKIVLSTLPNAPMNIDLKDLAAASDVLAVLQRQEAKDRQVMHDALVRIGSALQAVVKGLVGFI